MASLPFRTGGLGLRNVQRTRSTAYWASWADVIPMIRLRHPEVADHIVLSLSRGLGGFHLEGAFESRALLLRAGIDAPEWGDVDRGQRPRCRPDDEFPGFSRQGWQNFASSQMEEAFFQHNVVPRLEPTEQALVQSQRGLMAGIPFFCPPVSCASRFDVQCFRVLLLRRLWCPLPLSSAICRCGQPLDPRGYHRAACVTSGVLGRRGYPLESCAALVCREAGARVFTNLCEQDLDLLPGVPVDSRRLEVVADGLPLFHGAQLALDTTLVSPVRADGGPRRQCATTDGAALEQARRRKELRFPELTGEQGRARLVVLACETGRRWSEEAQDFLRQLARARARSEPPRNQRRCEACLVQEVVYGTLLLRGTSVRDVAVGAPRGTRCRWRVAIHF